MLENKNCYEIPFCFNYLVSIDEEKPWQEDHCSEQIEYNVCHIESENKHQFQIE
jgi:hypothetical protein